MKRYIIFLCIVGVVIPLSLASALCCQQESASGWYQRCARTLLRYAKVHDADQVAVYTMGPLRGLASLVPGETRLDGIRLNEELLDHMSDGEKWWVIAHEVAHYTLEHVASISRFDEASRVKSTVPSVMVNAIAGAALLLVKNHVPGFVNIAMLAASLYMSMRATKESIQMYELAIQLKNEYMKTLEKEADLLAADLLCQAGYQDFVKEHIEFLRVKKEKMVILVNEHNHPSYEESYVYMVAFWRDWQQQHVGMAGNRVVSS